MLEDVAKPRLYAAQGCPVTSACSIDGNIAWVDSELNHDHVQHQRKLFEIGLITGSYHDERFYHIDETQRHVPINRHLVHLSSAHVQRFARLSMGTLPPASQAFRCPPEVDVAHQDKVAVDDPSVLCPCTPICLRPNCGWLLLIAQEREALSQ